MFPGRQATYNEIFVPETELASGRPQQVMAKWAERPPNVMKLSQRWNTLQICPCQDSNSGGSDPMDGWIDRSINRKRESVKLMTHKDVSSGINPTNTVISGIRILRLRFPEKRSTRCAIRASEIVLKCSLIWWRFVILRANAFGPVPETPMRARARAYTESAQFKREIAENVPRIQTASYINKLVDSIM